MKTITFIIALVYCTHLNTQVTEDTAIKKVINNLFSNMQKFDSANMRVLFDPTPVYKPLY
ncbi:MAG: hypothetical protein H7296_03460 [Bacteroidia bacterium]|nr:hypothetical protein [Bacteroidia bacterium]